MSTRAPKMDDPRFLSEDLKIWACYDINSTPPPAITVKTKHLHFTCEDPVFDLSLSKAKVQKGLVYEDIFENETEYAQTQTAKIALDTSHSASFQWNRALAFDNKIKASLPHELHIEDFKDITVGQLGVEKVSSKATIPRDIEVRVPPGGKLKLEIFIEEEIYQSEFSVQIVPKDGDDHAIQNVTAKITGKPDKWGNLKEIFKDLSKTFKLPGYKKHGSFKAKGVCDMKRTIKHSHKISHV